MNDLEKTIAAYKPDIDAAVNKFCQETSAQMREDYGPELSQVLDALLQILQRGGKRFRGALAMYSYELFGGFDQKTAAQLGLAVEMLQAYLLVIDDICDRSDLRRGGPSAHKLIEQLHKREKLAGDAAHFGISETIFAGIIGQNLAYDVLSEMDIDGDTRLAAMTFANSIMIKTNIGQIMDVAGEAWLTDNEEQVLATLRQKTAWYSMYMPLQLGAIVAGAGAKDDDAKLIKPFALNAGLAFQIYDDIFSTFGDEAKTGKPVKGDIIEGKRTLLVVHALANGSESEAQILSAALGNPNLTDQDFAQVLDILRMTGALDYARQTAAEYATKAAAVLDEAPAKFAGKLDLLKKITEYKV
ncbi:polyprenyl synthetase family protein [Candidatus Saccharibacteria bacterium]|nr:polyprenyl synthetase family protein [Candidatus Saccharibacteria bacterium]